MLRKSQEVKNDQDTSQQVVADQSTPVTEENSKVPENAPVSTVENQPVAEKKSTFTPPKFSVLTKNFADILVDGELKEHGVSSVYDLKEKRQNQYLPVYDLIDQLKNDKELTDKKRYNILAGRLLEIESEINTNEYKRTSPEGIKVPLFNIKLTKGSFTSQHIRRTLGESKKAEESNIIDDIFVEEAKKEYKEYNEILLKAAAEKKAEVTVEVKAKPQAKEFPPAQELSAEEKTKLQEQHKQRLFGSIKDGVEKQKINKRVTDRKQREYMEKDIELREERREYLKPKM